MSVERIGVIGAGLVGLAVARRLTELMPDVRVTVLDKELDVAAHQSGHNSGVVHAGIYYPPGSLKATLCRRGMGMLREYCADKGIVYDERGKLVLAVDDGERAALESIRERAETNGVPGMRSVDAVGLREIEPHAVGVAGLYSPHTAITDYPAIARAMAEDIRAAGSEVLLGKEIVRIGRDRGRVRVATREESLGFDRLVICAGLQSDILAEAAGDSVGPAIVPFRGEYLRLVPERTDLVRGLIYPVPDPRYPFLGVHFTRRVDGSVDLGPNAVLAMAREGYRLRDLNLGQTWGTFTYPGFRRMAAQHWRMGMKEYRTSLSRRAFLAEARRYVPELTASDVVAAQAGVRAQAVDPDGTLVDDFRISELGPVVAVRNAPSPAATSSLAIAEYICDHPWRTRVSA
ncbi:MAG TPA: L-2-hydroxyglutarate oxidase [Actinomycetes bacterium]